MLGEAAHRLVKNTLNYKSNGSPRLLEQPSFRNFPGNYGVGRAGPAGNYAVTRPRPAGPSANERGYVDDPRHNYGNYNYPHGMTGNPRAPFSTNGMQGSRHNYRPQERFQYHDQYHDFRTEMSALRIDESTRSNTPAAMPSRMQSPGYSGNSNQQLLQNMGPPPSPPNNWIYRVMAGDAATYSIHESASSGAYEKQQVKKVYQIKARPPHEADPLNQQ